MFDINDKQKLIETIKTEIRCAYVPPNYSNNYNSNDVEKALINALSKTIENIAKEVAAVAAEAIVRHLYTYSEFETDLGLRDRP